MRAGIEPLADALSKSGHYGVPVGVPATVPATAATGAPTCNSPTRR